MACWATSQAARQPSSPTSAMVEPFGILLVNSLHLLGVVAVELSGGEETRARFAVSFCHRQQLVEQLLIHVPSYAPSTPLVQARSINELRARRQKFVQRHVFRLRAAQIDIFDIPP